MKRAVKRIPISEHTGIVSKKSEVVHEERDTVESKDHRGEIGTFVDIKSKCVVIRKVNRKSYVAMKNSSSGL